MNADLFPENWVTYGGNYAEDRYSILTQINKDNVNRLQLKWVLNLGTKRGIEATPLVADGIMFLTSTWSKVHAIDTRTGTLIWTFDPEVPKYYGEKLCCDVVNRGVALYKGRIYFGTLDGRLIALDAATGKVVWDHEVADRLALAEVTAAKRTMIINAVPREEGRIAILNSGAPKLERITVFRLEAIERGGGWGDFLREEVFPLTYNVTGDRSQGKWYPN